MVSDVNLHPYTTGYHAFALFEEAKTAAAGLKYNHLQSNKKRLASHGTNGIHFTSAYKAHSDQLMVHRIGGGFKLNPHMGGTGFNFWTFRVAGKGFWKEGGFLSIFRDRFERDLCDSPKCDLSRCTTDPCDIQVHLDEGSSYIVMLHGFNRRKDSSGQISLEYKPPDRCFTYENGCVGVPMDQCKKLRPDKMPWYSLKLGNMVNLECDEASHAEVVSLTVKTKPFCMAPEMYSPSTLKQCWPPYARRAQGAGGCDGEYDITKAKRNNVYTAAVAGSGRAVQVDIRLTLG